ncbi:MAG: alpha/beta hydrolase [Pseudomonadota bacterium]
MPTIHLGPQDALYYEYAAPTYSEGCTYVFFNPLTGDTSMWQAVIAPRLRQSGHGTLLYNYRGQMNSPFAPGTKLDDKLIVADVLRLLDEIKPARPVLTGLSIGGLFAACSWLSGAKAMGLILINVLRRDGPRLKWISDALIRCVEIGGMDLFRDVFTPLLFGEDWLNANRPNFFKSGPYNPIDKQSGHYNLIFHSKEADWDLPYEHLTLPTLVITGLQDRIFYDQKVLGDLFTRLPQARRIDFPDAGHLIPAERPEALAEALLDFSRELTIGVSP